MSERSEIESVLKRIVSELRISGELPNNYSIYLLPLLFFRWLSQINAMNDGGEKELPEAFRLRKEADWDCLETIAASQSIPSCQIGAQITDILFLAEESNDRLKGLLVDPDVSQWISASNQSLKNLIKSLSRLDFDKSFLESPERFSDAYESLLVNLEPHWNRRSIHFFTPRSLQTLIVKLTEPKVGMRVCDPVCGSGELLVEAVRHIKNQGKRPDEITLWGKEEIYELRTAASVSLLLHQATDAHITPGNIIEEYLPREKMEFDIILTNPPFGVRSWKRDSLRSVDDFEYGDPPNNSADYVFIQRVLSMLSEDGKAAMIVPHGVLFREASEGEIRMRIVQEDLVEAVIGLPKNLFRNTGIATAIIIFNKRKTINRKGKTIFIDASQDYSSGRSGGFLAQKDIARITSVSQDFREEVGYSKVVSLPEISENDYLLTVSRYVIVAKERQLDIKSRINETKELEEKRRRLEIDMDDCLSGLGVID